MKTRKKLGQNWNQQFAESSNGGTASVKHDTSGLTVLSASSKQLQLSGNANTPSTANVWKSSFSKPSEETVFSEAVEEIINDVAVVTEEEDEEEEKIDPEAASQPNIVATVVTPHTNKEDTELSVTVAAWDEYGGRGTNSGKPKQLVETASSPPKEQPPPPTIRKTRPQRNRGGRNKKLQALKNAAQEPSENPAAANNASRKLFDPATGSLVEFAPGAPPQRGGREHHHHHHHRGNHHGRNGRNQNRHAKRAVLVKETEGDLKASAKAFSPPPVPSPEPKPGLALDLDALVAPTVEKTNKSSNIFAFGSAGTWGADAAPNATGWSLD